MCCWRRLSWLSIGYCRMDLRVELDVIDTGHRRPLYSSPETPPQCVHFGVPLHRGFDDRIMRHPPAGVTGQGPFANWVRGGGPCRNGDVAARPECLISPGDGSAVRYTVLYNNGVDATMSGEHNFMRVIVSWSESNPIHIPIRPDRPRRVRGESETSAWESVVIVLGRTRRKSSCRPARRRHPRGDLDATNNIFLTNKRATIRVICARVY